MDLDDDRVRARATAGAGAAVALLLVLSLVGLLLVGDGDEVPLHASTPVAAVRQVPDELRRAGSHRMELRTNLGTATVGQSCETSADQRTRCLVRSLAGEVELVTDGQELYVRLPPGTSKRPWGRVRSAAGTAGEAGLSARAGQVYVEALAAVEAAEDLGTERVRGVRARRLRTTLPVDGLGPLGDVRASADVWVAADRLVRRLTVQIDAGVLEATTTLDFSDFGDDIRVELPPAAQVQDVDPATVAAILRR